jgi:peptidoglycan/LPS O-acetylase OafA/YrhL
MKYRPDIDGLRALAVIPVVLYHTRFTLFRGGFVGVDIFFVISGYLITFIIHEEIKENRFTVTGFYERRVRRIFPALFTVVFFSSTVAALIMLPQGFENFGQSVVAATLFVANIYFLTESDYFGPAADTQPLLHTWSLSVEEQFYVIFPLLLLLIHRYCKGNWRPILLPAALISLLFSISGVYFFPSATFYLLPTRGWELLLGSFLALGLFPKLEGQQARNITSLIGLCLILWAIFFFTRLTPFPGWHALIPCVGAALIIYSGTGGTSLAGRLLSYRLFVFVGLISYSLYLWHWPLMVFEKQLFSEQYARYSGVAVVVLSCMLAVLSWRYVERPFRKKGTVKQRRKLFAVAAGIMTVSVAFGYGVDVSQGWPARFAGKLIALNCDLKTYNLGTCFLREDQPVTDWQGKKCFLQSGKATTALLWGDSFAAHYVPGIKDNLNLIDSNILQYTAGGCAPVFDFNPVYRPRCKEFSARVDHLISSYGIHTVVMAAGWRLAMENGLSFEALKNTVETLRRKGLRVVVIGQSPRFDQSVQDISNRAEILGTSISESTVSMDIESINTKLREIAGPDNFVDPSKLFCVKGKCRFKSSAGFYFWDDGHLTALGSRLSAEYIFSTIKI